MAYFTVDNEVQWAPERKAIDRAINHRRAWIRELGEIAVGLQQELRSQEYNSDDLSRCLARARSNNNSLVRNIRDLVNENNEVNEENDFLKECIKTQAENIAYLQEGQCNSEECDERLIDNEEAAETVDLLADVAALLEKIEAFGSGD